MSFNDKILKALSSTLTYLDKAVSALRKGDENAFSNDMWHVAAELEYALFLFLLTLEGSGQNIQRLKPNSETINPPVGDVMLKVKELVEESQNFLMKGDFSNAYRCVYLARHYIFKVQESLDKKTTRARGTNRKD
jgi:hypothetical protein